MRIHAFAPLSCYEAMETELLGSQGVHKDVTFCIPGDFSGICDKNRRMYEDGFILGIHVLHHCSATKQWTQEFYVAVCAQR